VSFEKRFKRKQGLLNRLLSSANFLVSEDTGTFDMRASSRIECRAKFDYVDENAKSGAGFLVDISRTGIQIETERKMPKGITLALNAPEDDKLEQNVPFMATVRWTRKTEDGKYRAGLALPPGVVDDPHWLEALLEQLGYAEDELPSTSSSIDPES
jgi:PilZ domain